MAEKITGRQAVSLLFLFELGSSILTGSSDDVGQDSWAAILIGMALTVPLVLLFARMGALAPGRDFFDMSELAFGKVGGGIVALAFSLYSLHLGAMVVRNFTEYVSVLSLSETPQMVVAACMGLLAWFAVRRGIAVPARNASFIAPLAGAVVVLLLVLTTSYMDFDNLRPALVSDPKLLLQKGFSSFVFPFAESVLFLSVFCYIEKEQAPLKKYYFMGTLLPGLLLMAIVVDNIAVLGVQITQDMYFPAYETVSIVQLGNFLSRIEVLVSGNFMIFGLVKFTVCVYVAARGFMHLPGKKNWKLVTALTAAGGTAASGLLYRNTMEMFSFLYVYDQYAPYFEVALPLAVYLTLRCRGVGAKKQELPADSAPETPEQAL